MKENEKTNPKQIDSWILNNEGRHFEFKEAKAKFDDLKLFKYCVAIANEGGGKMLLGVTDKAPRIVIGSLAYKSTEKISDKILQKLGFRVDVENVKHPDGTVTIFHIPGRPSGTAYNFEGAYYMRSNEQLVAMSEDRLREIFSESKSNWEKEFALEGFSDQDVVEILDTQKYFEMKGRHYPSARDGVMEALEFDGVILEFQNSWTITNFGLLLFARNLENTPLSRKMPRIIVYDGPGKIQTQLEKTWSKGYAVGFEELIEFVNGQIPSNEVIESAVRDERKMFPAIAVRELVANALIHQDFGEHGTSVLIELFSDRLEISNPGKPLFETARFIDTHKSRNEEIANRMRLLGICEEKGSGVDKVVQAAEIFQLPPPDFRIGVMRTISVLYAYKDFEKMDSDDRQRACYQHCVLRYVMNQKMTNSSLRERFGLSKKQSATASQIIKATITQELIIQEKGTSKKYANYRPWWA